MRRRWIIVSVALLAVLLVFIRALWFPTEKEITVPLSYSIITNKIMKWKPGRIPSRGLPSDVKAEEKVAGEIFVRSIFERGDPKFGPFTVVSVFRLDASQTVIKLSTTQAALFGLLGKRHLFFIERRRWKEIQELVQQ
jgi:hypothetical protein